MTRLCILMATEVSERIDLKTFLVQSDRLIHANEGVCVVNEQETKTSDIFCSVFEANERSIIICFH